MNKVLGVLFAFFCFASAAVSNSLMGPGFWFWLIIATGLFVGISQFYPWLRGAGAGLSFLLALILFAGIALSLLAATIGGSFKLEDSFAFLLFLFFITAILGLSLASNFKRFIQSGNQAADNIAR